MFTTVYKHHIKVCNDASDEELWGVNCLDHIFRKPVDGSGSWIRIGGSLKHISASGNGYIWGVNSN